MLYSSFGHVFLYQGFELSKNCPEDAAISALTYFSRVAEPTVPLGTGITSLNLDLNSQKYGA
jgi:hypothetical protein